MYTKRTYKEVRDTFEWDYSGKQMFIRWTTVGINDLGIWLWAYIDYPPYGFFEWKWIKEILISEKNEFVYFVMYNMDDIYDNVVLYIPKFVFKLSIVEVNQGNDKAIAFPYRDDVLKALEYASKKEWAKVISIE